MANAKNNKRALIEGRAALIIIDIQASTFIEDSLVSSIDNMPGYNERMLKARVAIDKVRLQHSCYLHSRGSSSQPSRFRA